MFIRIYDCQSDCNCELANIESTGITIVLSLQLRFQKKKFSVYIFTITVAIVEQKFEF